MRDVGMGHSRGSTDIPCLQPISMLYFLQAGPDCSAVLITLQARYWCLIIPSAVCCALGFDCDFMVNLSPLLHLHSIYLSDHMHVAMLCYLMLVKLKYSSTAAYCSPGSNFLIRCYLNPERRAFHYQQINAQNFRSWPWYKVIRKSALWSSIPFTIWQVKINGIGQPGTNISFRTNFPCRASCLWVLLARHDLWLARNKLEHILEWHVLFIKDLMIWKPFPFSFCCIVCICLCICAEFSIYKCVDCSENQLAYSGKWKLKCTCPKAIFSKLHLPGQSGKYLCRTLPTFVYFVYFGKIIPNCEQESFRKYLKVKCYSERIFA